MAFEERRRDVADPQYRSEFWKRRISRIQLGFRRAEEALEKAVSDFDRLADDIETGLAPVPIRPARKSHEQLPLPVATEFAVRGGQRVAFVVHRVQFTIELSPARMDLLALLTTAVREESDHLVGFKTSASLVQNLRARGWDATRRSVTVEVSRLRAALGPTNRHLIEARRGVGYRFRLLHAAASSSGPSSKSADARLTL